MEASVVDSSNYFFQTVPGTREQDSSPYRSKSEQVIANIFKKADISFGYEDALPVPREYTGSKSDRTWHPDFNLRDLGVIVEYVGKPDDKAYMKGIERKREVYAKMGVAVIWLYPEDLWEQTKDREYGALRDDVEEHILRKIGKITAKMMNHDCKVAGIQYKTDKGFTDFHALRVFFITSLHRNNVGLAMAQKAARHSYPKLTSNVYSKVSPQERAEAVGGSVLRQLDFLSVILELKTVVTLVVRRRLILAKWGISWQKTKNVKLSTCRNLAIVTR